MGGTTLLTLLNMSDLPLNIYFYLIIVKYHVLFDVVVRVLIGETLNNIPLN